MAFVDNHDVSRIASILTEKKHLPLIYGMAFTMPGFPCIYYGSEWGAEGRKQDGDSALRLSYDMPVWNELCDFISRLSKVKKNSKALNYGDFKSEVLTNRQCIFSRGCEEEKVYVALNADNNTFYANMPGGHYKDLMSEEDINIENSIELRPYEFRILRMV